MAYVEKCCFFCDNRKGSIVSACYILIFYTITFMVDAIHLNTTDSFSNIIRILSIILVILAPFAICSSFLLLIGLKSDNSTLFIPWLISVLLLTILEFASLIYSIYTYFNGVQMQLQILVAPFVPIDLVICFSNVYSLICVLSLFCDLRQSKITKKDQQKYLSPAISNELTTTFQNSSNTINKIHQV